MAFTLFNFRIQSRTKDYEYHHVLCLKMAERILSVELYILFFVVVHLRCVYRSLTSSTQSCGMYSFRFRAITGRYFLNYTFVYRDKQKN